MPIFSAQALCDQTLSTLRPSTCASSCSNCFMSFTQQACSVVQTGLQSRGWKTSTTRFLPWKSLSLTSCWFWSLSENSGAGVPMVAGICSSVRIGFVECLLDDRRLVVGWLLFVSVDFAIVFGVEGAMLGIELLGSHGEDVAAFLAFEAGGVVSALGIDHALGE